MKNITLLFLTLLFVGIAACNNNDDNDNDCLDNQEEVGFKNYKVDFYATHKNFVVQPATFETVTEQALLKPAHQEGAFFETVTEQYLSKESFKRHQILDSMIIHLVANSETDSIAEVACYHFFEEADFVEIEVPAEYKTRITYQLAQQGTGVEIPATYMTLTRRHVMSDGEIVATTDEQQFKRIAFSIPKDQTMQEYLANQFSHQSIMECVEGNSYKIQE